MIQINMVYAAQPREGTETTLEFHPLSHQEAASVYAAQPREGTETIYAELLTNAEFAARFTQLNPARGRKPGEYLLYQGAFQRGLCSSTPRGDGNVVGP